MNDLEGAAVATAGLPCSDSSTTGLVTTPAVGGVRWDTDRLLAAINAGDVHTVTLAMVDLHGRLVGKHHNGRHFADRVLTHGEHACAYLLAADIDMTPTDAFELSGWETGYGDLLLMPDTGAVYLLPGRPGEALVFADAIDDGAPVAVSPRRILADQIERLSGRGLTARIGVESEYTLIHAPAEPRPGQPWPAIEPVTHHNADYAATHPAPVAEHLRALMQAVTAAGLPIEAAKTESAPGQVEVTFAPGDPLKAADDFTVFKAVTRRAAAEHALHALFMAAPDSGSGNGLHLHLSLQCDGAEATDDGEGALSPTASFAIAGLIEGLPQLMPLLAPTVNAYRRYRPQSFAPTSWSWGSDNRTCAVRVTGGQDNLHLEVRVAGADANIYLALAAILGAITDGIDREAPCPKPVFGNAYADPDPAPIATTLAEALADFRAGELAARLFGAKTADHLARAAALELAGHREEITASELHRAMRA